MKRNVILATTLAATLGIAACDGFKEALTAHVDVVARAGTQELSVTRLADLLGNAKVPLRKDVANAVADMWISYQLLGYAAAHDDSLHDPKIADQAMWAMIAQEKSKAFYDHVSKEWVKVDSASLPAKYAAGEMLAARHILLMSPRQGATEKEREAVRAELEKIRKTVTPANFADVAKAKSQDGSKANGGALGVFPPGAMVPEFENAVKALKPGEVSGIVETQFGFHLIKRQTYDEVAKEFAQAYTQIATQKAESTFMAAMEKGADVQVKSGASKLTKEIAQDVDAHRDDKSTLVTWKGGSLNAARLVQWMAAMPPQARIREQVVSAPDTAIPYFLKQVARNELVLHAADSAKLAPDTAVLENLRNAFYGQVAGAMSELKVSPFFLKDSAKTVSERERLAASRIDGYFDLLLNEKAQFVNVPEPVSSALRAKYESRIVAAGIERALERAAKIRQVADSTRAAQQPASAVPMPGSTPPAAQPAAPAPKPVEPAKKP
ncbi:MAG: peptidylprolyl isomerase [Gemmatimonadaceae bacterium]|nr:peptidylprolyl isomerase [Gemmatimonadaceae bacterium]